MAYKFFKKKEKKDVEDYFITLDGITYDLRKIKPVDRYSFLEGAKMMGKKSFSDRISPFYTGSSTIESEKARRIFEKIEEEEK